MKQNCLKNVKNKILHLVNSVLVYVKQQVIFVNFTLSKITGSYQFILAISRFREKYEVFSVNDRARKHCELFTLIIMQTLLRSSIFPIKLEWISRIFGFRNRIGYLKVIVHNEASMSKA